MPQPIHDDLYNEAYAIAQSIFRHLRKVDGYQPYGYDWRTLRLTRPQTAVVLEDCYRRMGVLV